MNNMNVPGSRIQTILRAHGGSDQFPRQQHSDLTFSQHFEFALEILSHRIFKMDSYFHVVEGTRRAVFQLEFTEVLAQGDVLFESGDSDLVFCALEL